MPSNRIVKWGAIAIAVLIVANIIVHIYSGWGLITVKVHDAPLGKVIKSIEWQGWVKIYSNISPDAKVSMWVDHVPLAEAMETLAVNITLPPRPDNPPGGGAPGGTPPDANTNAPATAGAPPPSGGPNLAGGAPPAGGPPGGGPGGPGGPGGQGARQGRGGGGFGGGIQWNLAFFVAPTSAQVKAEIQAFQAGNTDDDIRVYTYQTPLQFVANGDTDLPAADPRLQAWPGYKAPDLSAAPPPPPAADGQPAAPAAPTTPTVQTYLQAFAESSNIWIMTPGSWAPDASSAPPANASIITAIKNFVSRSNGSMTQAIVLRQGRGARGGGNFAGNNRGGGGGGGFSPFGANMDAMTDRMRNAINGLPPDARADALDQLNKEVAFYQTVQAAPPDQKMKLVQDHMMEKMANGNGMNRMSPEKRAARFTRAVTARAAVKGK